MAVVLTEKINTYRANFLLDNYTYENFYTTWEGSATDAKIQYDKVIKFLVSKTENEGTNAIKYTHTKGRVNGRMYGEKSLQCCPREVRGFLCDGISTDIDIVNAHPVLLLNICNKHSIECPNLKEYCEQRENCLERVMEADNINRSKAKKKVLVSTNLNNRISTNCEFLKNYDKEMKKIQKKLLDVEEFEYLKDFAKKDSNFNGSFINHILCVEEDAVLYIMRESCDSVEVKVQALMFDGLMAYGDMSVGFLKHLEDQIRKEDYTNIVLIEKSHEYDFVVPDDYKATIITKYEDVREEFEKRNVKVGHLFVNELDDGETIYKKGDFGILHEELKFIKKRKDKQFINEWFTDIDKRKYDYFDSFPKDSICPKNCYNLFKPFAITKVGEIDKDLIPDCEKALQYFKNHISVLCNHEEIMVKFVLMWIAQMVQYPEFKSVELVFISQEGAGKGLLLEFFKTILGGDKRCWETTDPQRDIFGQFNGSMKDAFLVIMNEANKSNFYNANDKKKGLITDPMININIKSIPAFPMRSYHRFITFSNNPAPTIPNKRRDAIIRCSDEKIDNVPYFNEGWKYATDLNCCKYIYDWLLKEPTKPKITGVDIPLSSYHEALIEVHRSSIVEFIEDKSGEWFNTDHKEKPIKEVSSLSFYDLFRYYCNENHIENHIGQIGFGMKIEFMNLKSITKKNKKVEGKAVNTYFIDIDLLYKELKLDLVE